MTGALDTPSVRVEQVDTVATVLVDNPPANTLPQRVIEELDAVLARLATDETARVVVLTSGVPGRFLAGGDIGELLAAIGDDDAIAHHVGSTRQLFGRLETMPQPLIAAVDGHAVGGGLEILLCCDLVIASSAARFGTPEVRLGLIPGAGGTQRLSRRAGLATALELVLTGQLLSADEAKAAGLVTSVVAPGEARAIAAELAGRLAALPSGAVQAGKRVVRGGSELPLADGLDLERAEFVARLGSAEARAGLAAFLDR